MAHFRGPDLVCHHLLFRRHFATSMAFRALSSAARPSLDARLGPVQVAEIQSCAFDDRLFDESSLPDRTAITSLP